MTNSNFAFGTFWGFFPQIFSIRGWFNPSLGKPWIWRGDYMSKLQIKKKKKGRGRQPHLTSTHSSNSLWKSNKVVIHFPESERKWGKYTKCQPCPGGAMPCGDMQDFRPLAAWIGIQALLFTRAEGLGEWFTFSGLLSAPPLCRGASTSGSWSYHESHGNTKHLWQCGHTHWGACNYPPGWRD